MSSHRAPLEHEGHNVTSTVKEKLSKKDVADCLSRIEHHFYSSDHSDHGSSAPLSYRPLFFEIAPNTIPPQVLKALYEVEKAMLGPYLPSLVAHGQKDDERPNGGNSDDESYTIDQSSEVGQAFDMDHDQAFKTDQTLKVNQEPDLKLKHKDLMDDRSPSLRIHGKRPAPPIVSDSSTKKPRLTTSEKESSQLIPGHVKEKEPRDIEGLLVKRGNHVTVDAKVHSDATIGKANRRKRCVDLEVLREVVSSLDPGEWVQGTAIHLILSRLVNRDIGYVDPLLLSSGKLGKRNLHLKDYPQLLIPVIHNRHWALFQWRQQQCSLTVLDSLPNEKWREETKDVVLQFLSTMYDNFNFNSEKVTMTVEDCPKQDNSNDCGVWLMYHAIRILCDAKPHVPVSTASLRKTFQYQLLSSSDAVPLELLSKVDPDWDGLRYMKSMNFFLSSQWSERSLSLAHAELYRAKYCSQAVSEVMSNFHERHRALLDIAVECQSLYNEIQAHLDWSNVVCDIDDWQQSINSYCAKYDGKDGRDNPHVAQHRWNQIEDASRIIVSFKILMGSPNDAPLNAKSSSMMGNTTEQTYCMTSKPFPTVTPEKGKRLLGPFLQRNPELDYFPDGCLAPDFGSSDMEDLKEHVRDCWLMVKANLIIIHKISTILGSAGIHPKTPSLNDSLLECCGNLQDTLV